MARDKEAVTVVVERNSRQMTRRESGVARKNKCSGQFVLRGQGTKVKAGGTFGVWKEGIFFFIGLQGSRPCWVGEGQACPYSVRRTSGVGLTEIAILDRKGQDTTISKILKKKSQSTGSVSHFYAYYMVYFALVSG
jgi:hypothetical protein